MHTPAVEHMMDLHCCRADHDVNTFSMNVGIYLKGDFSGYYFNYPLKTMECVDCIVRTEGCLLWNRSFVVSGKFLSAAADIIPAKVNSIMSMVSEGTIEDAVNMLTSYFMWENEDILYDEWLNNSRIICKKDACLIRPVVASCTVVNDDRFTAKIILQISDGTPSKRIPISLSVLTCDQLRMMVNAEIAVYCKGMLIVSERDKDRAIMQTIGEIVAIAESCVGDTWDEVLISLRRHFHVL